MMSSNINNDLNSIVLYFKDVDGGPLLTRKQERALVQVMDQARFRDYEGHLSTKHLWKDDADSVCLANAQRARQKLVTCNLRLVASIAKHFQNQGCDFEDLIQEGNIGLMDGIDRFEWTKGWKISTYCTWWIRQRIDRLISNHGRTVRVPVHVQTLSSKLKKIVDNYEHKFNQLPSVSEIVKALDCTEDMAKAAMDALNPNNMVNLDHSPSSQVDNDESLHSYVKDDEAISPMEFVSHKELVDLVRNVISELPERDEKILRLRFGIAEDPTNHEAFPITEEELNELKRRAKEQ